MKSSIASALRATGFVALFVFTTAGIPTNGIPTNGIPTNGIPTNGIPTNGIPTNGIPTNGASLDLLEKTLIFGNASVHNALISKPFTAASLTNAQSPLFQIWSDPASALLASYLWQDVHPSGDDFTFTTPSGVTYRFYGNVGACVDMNGHGWGRDAPQDLTCAKWVSALIITQINQSGIHNIFSARGPSSTAGQPGFIGN